MYGRAIIISIAPASARPASVRFLNNMCRVPIDHR
jgi:hypothetical protein